MSLEWYVGSRLDLHSLTNISRQLRGADPQGLATLVRQHAGQNPPVAPHDEEKSLKPVVDYAQYISRDAGRLDAVIHTL